MCIKCRFIVYVTHIITTYSLFEKKNKTKNGDKIE